MKLTAEPSSTTQGPGTLVNLRIVGKAGTVFQYPIFTHGHDVNPPTGCKHHCDGTNNGTYCTPGPTATSALDDAAQLAGFKWDGTYFPKFDDYLIISIAGDTNTSTQFWSIFVNYRLGAGGCQQRVELLDDVLFAYDGYNKTLLRLSGPQSARLNEQVTFTVVDGRNGEPVANATVDGYTTGGDGQVLVSFHDKGLKTVSADKDGTIPSNVLQIFIADESINIERDTVRLLDTEL